MTYPTGDLADTPNDPVVTDTALPTPPPATPLPSAPQSDTSEYGAHNDSDQSSIKDKAADSAQAGKDAAGEVAQTAVDKAKSIAEETQRQARDLVGEARTQAANEAARHHRNAAAGLHSLGDELTAMSRNSDQSGVASDVAAQGGQRAHDFASWLDDREPGELLDELRGFARRHPGAFLVGALAAGVVAGRLTRGAVAAHRDSDDDDSGGLQADTPAPSVAVPHAPTSEGFAS